MVPKVSEPKDGSPRATSQRLFCVGEPSRVPASNDGSHLAGFGARQQDNVVTSFLERDAAVETRFTATTGSSARSLTNRAMQWFVRVVVVSMVSMVAVAAGTGAGTAAPATPPTPDSAAGPRHTRLPETAA
jgi:hypothetical protein